MILNAEIHSSPNPITDIPVVVLHGLFGSLSNLGMIARKLLPNYHVIQLDLRNHGLSPHADKMDYELMAADVIETLDHLAIHKFSLIGHSMGGKVSMKIAGLVPERLQRLAILDVAPVAYVGERHEGMFTAIEAVIAENNPDLSRSQAAEIMRKKIDNEMIIQFLLKSFIKGKWLYNIDALKSSYVNLVGWNSIQPWIKPCLFIKGGNSEYVLPKYYTEIEKQFPKAIIETVPETGHWLHAEKPDTIVSMINQYFLS